MLKFITLGVLAGSGLLLFSIGDVIASCGSTTAATHSTAVHNTPSTHSRSFSNNAKNSGSSAYLIPKAFR